MRIFKNHIVNPVNDKVQVAAMDEPGPGGAHHFYRAWWMGDDGAHDVEIRFQNGPIGEVGVNGLPDDVLLVILIDRLECFQSGPFQCWENYMELQNLRLALSASQHRTRERMARGVEGTTQK